MNELGIKLQLQKPSINRFSFIEMPTKESLMNDIRTLVVNINTMVGTFQHQKERILALNYHFKEQIDTYKSEILDYYSLKVLDELKHFILITDKSKVNFNFELQLIIEGEKHIIKSNRR